MNDSGRNERQLISRQGGKSGLPPGTPVFVGERKQEVARIDITNYGHDRLDVIADATLEDCAAARDSTGVSWINVTGIHDVALTQALANLFGLHPLTTEDIANASQRPKAEEFDHYLFFVLKMLDYDGTTQSIRQESVSVILGEHYILSFQERDGDVLDPLRERIRTNKGRLRGLGPDFLAYAIMDAVVDEYFVSLERLGDYVEDVDDEILSDPDAGHMREIHRLKREIVYLRKAIWPLREEIATIEKSGTRLIQPETRLFLRDLYDHTVQAIDMVETYRDIIGGMHDTFLSSNSNRMNEVMKVLTIIGTIFIPLTFIAGIYGMNFRYMPELQWHWGYYGLLGIMAVIAAGMLLFFKRRRWL